MRDYAKVSPQFWTRGSGKRLRGDADAQVLALYLVTCPSANMVGVYYVPFVAVAHETGLGIERTRAAIERLSVAGFAFYDEDAELAWVPNMASYQIGDELKEGDKRRGGPIRAELEKIGEHDFVRQFWERYGDGYGLGDCPFAPPTGTRSIPLPCPSDAPPKGDGPHSGRAGAGEEQEKEQEHHVADAPSSAHAERTSGVMVKAKKQTGKRPKTTIPPDFAVSPAIEEMCRAERLPDPHRVLVDFRDKAMANDYRYADWEAAFRTWMRSDITRRNYPAWKAPEPPRPPPAPQAPDLPREEVYEAIRAGLALFADPFAKAAGDQ